ncbi:MAG: hypothetical protein HOE48_19860 [Candidatus Latescibacteria bacterium]|jgi:hypothetical protein|nr:hypothetical protein [Candidatus Latescibacterota bacterium]MBT4140183.1 hypothetical protein [Candidatus Latescibacterota bacterium]MBT5828721.1 hypothetical protein [Candidatus Latescibacterota bacterium]
MSIEPEAPIKDEIMDGLWSIKDQLAASAGNDLKKLVSKMNDIAAQQKNSDQGIQKK